MNATRREFQAIRLGPARDVLDHRMKVEGEYMMQAGVRVLPQPRLFFGERGAELKDTAVLFPEDAETAGKFARVIASDNKRKPQIRAAISPKAGPLLKRADFGAPFIDSIAGILSFSRTSFPCFRDEHILDNVANIVDRGDCVSHWRACEVTRAVEDSACEREDDAFDMVVSAMCTRRTAKVPKRNASAGRRTREKLIDSDLGEASDLRCVSA
ncbi:hypothetical protein [Methylocystis parvus]|uniref:hypothetical protein n=1 Tax=Methylocystis parvus TaxID=134 RepID=UPI003C71FD6D